MQAAGNFKQDHRSVLRLVVIGDTSSPKAMARQGLPGVPFGPSSENRSSQLEALDSRRSCVEVEFRVSVFS